MIPIVYINCKCQPFIRQILNRTKLFETRNRNTLGRFLGERILLAETGTGKHPVVKGSAVISEIIEIYSPWAWDVNRLDCMIPVGSEYDWKPDTKKKVLYRLTDVRPCKPFVPTDDRRHGRVWMEYNGTDIFS